MKKPVWRQRWPWLLCVLVLLAGITVCWFPARWAWTWVADRYPQVRVAAVDGSVWDGRMQGLVVDGVRLGGLRWNLGRSALWGQMHGSFDLDGPMLMADGHFRRADDGTTVVRDGHFRVPLQQLPLTWPGRKPPGGVLVGQLQHAQLVAGWPARLDATVTWQNAQVVANGSRIELGNFVMHWHEGKGAAIVADLSDQGDGPVALRGSIVLSPIGWRVDATLRPRTARADVRQLLGRLGRQGPDGSVRIQRHAGLELKGWMQ